MSRPADIEFRGPKTRVSLWAEHKLRGEPRPVDGRVESPQGDWEFRVFLFDEEFPELLAWLTDPSLRERTPVMTFLENEIAFRFHPPADFAIGFWDSALPDRDHSREEHLWFDLFFDQERVIDQIKTLRKRIEL